MGSGSRSMLLYIDVAGTTNVGSQMVDLLWEFNYGENGKGRQYYELQRIQYIPVPNNTLGIIETEVSEQDGTLAPFAEGFTSVTLKLKPAREVVVLHASNPTGELNLAF